MSRIGKKPIEIPQGVEIKIEGQKVTVKGPLGEEVVNVRPEIAVKVEEILQNVYPVKAKSLAEAIDKVKEKYKNGDIVLYAECLMETNFSEYKDNVPKDRYIGR